MQFHADHPSVSSVAQWFRNTCAKAKGCILWFLVLGSWFLVLGSHIP